MLVVNAANGPKDYAWVAAEAKAAETWNDGTIAKFVEPREPLIVEVPTTLMMLEAARKAEEP